ncbi:unnamed protein product [Symbiodinium microadriaticum]|nr:unnamed protein product [Symbiodinium microadriaticum]
MLEDVFPKAPQPLDVLAEQAHAGVNVRTSTRCRDREFVKRPFLFSGYLSGISERSASFDDFQYFHMDMCLSDSIEQETAGEEEPEEPQEEETQAARRPGKKEAASWEAFKASLKLPGFDGKKAGDEGEADAADPDGDADMEGAAKAPKKRGRAEGATNEPPMAAALAHSAVQALLDAWEAESDSEDGQGKRGTRSKRKRGDLAASTWIQEDGEVLTVRAPPSKCKLILPGALHSERSKRRIRTAFESKSRVIDPKHDQEATKHTLMKTPSVLYFSEVFKDDLFPKGKHVAVHPGNMSCSLGDEGRCLNVKSVGAAGAENKIDALRRSGLRFAADGRLVVDDAAEEKGKDEAPQFTHGTTSKPKALSQLAAQRKARAEAGHGYRDLDKRLIDPRELGRITLHAILNRLMVARRKPRRGVHVIKGMESYKPGRKRAQGDAKRKGAKLEPFAYVRLNPKVTKEKFKTKATETFSKVIKGAKKGVLKGKKARARDQKMKQAKEVKKKKQARRQQVRRTAAR